MSDDRKQDPTSPKTSPKKSPSDRSKAIARYLPTEKITNFWNSSTRKLQNLIPWDNVAKKANQLLSVDEEQVAQILDRVRQELPTTEAWLIGKPQAGKSSIVRGLTGVTEEIVGQGFQPHTNHTERYAYPSDDLPLLIFTDTVGLGDTERETATIIGELEAQLETQQQTRPYFNLNRQN